MLVCISKACEYVCQWKKQHEYVSSGKFHFFLIIYIKDFEVFLLLRLIYHVG
jgi:hypothetical protein